MFFDILHELLVAQNVCFWIKKLLRFFLLSAVFRHFLVFGSFSFFVTSVGVPGCRSRGSRPPVSCSLTFLRHFEGQKAWFRQRFPAACLVFFDIFGKLKAWFCSGLWPPVLCFARLLCLKSVIYVTVSGRLSRDLWHFCAIILWSWTPPKTPLVFQTTKNEINGTISLSKTTLSDQGSKTQFFNIWKILKMLKF